MKYSMKCTCGHVMTVDAADRTEAVTKMKTMMTQEMLDDHMNKFHKPDEPRPTLEQSHMMIEQNVVEGDLSQQAGAPPVAQA